METVLTSLTILKILIVLVGLILTFWYLIRGLTKKDFKGKNKALIHFFGTAGAIIVLSIIEFIALL